LWDALTLLSGESPLRSRGTDVARLFEHLGNEKEVSDDIYVVSNPALGNAKLRPAPRVK